MVRTIDPPRKFVVLGKPGSREYSDQYTESVPLLQSSYGPVFKKKGSYTVKAVYESYGTKLTSGKFSSSSAVLVLIRGVKPFCCTVVLV